MQYKVNDKINSDCGSSKLSDLDYSNWFTDTSNNMFYLHIKSLHDESIHRVFCKHDDEPRLALENNVLYWVITTKQNRKRDECD